MTFVTVVGHIGVRKGVGAFFIHMTLGACFGDGGLNEQGFAHAAVRLMTIDTDDLVIFIRVATDEGVFRDHVYVAVSANRFDVLSFNDDVGAVVNIMTVFTGDVGLGVAAGIPIVEIKGRVACMAAKAHKRCSRRRQRL